MSVANDINRLRANLRGEEESASLYRTFAKSEEDPNLKQVYQKLAEVEERHAAVWKQQLREQGIEPEPYRAGLRASVLEWMTRRFGVSAVLPMVTSMESKAVHEYDDQVVARAAGMPQQERSHARIFSVIRSTRGGMAGPALAQLEGRHRNMGGGNALRAAVLGASDGLTSNLSLVMGVAGASPTGKAVLVAGFAGMLAGALSMAIGEWLSVQSARELYSHQISVESEELASAPEEEAEELALIYQAKGLDEQSARELSRRIVADPKSALDTLAREELGIDPEELGGSAWQASITSFFLFAAGAILPVLPFIFATGYGAIVVSVILSIIGLFIIGAGITLTTGVPLVKAAGRQIIFGLLAAAITFGLGSLVGGAIR